MKIAVSCLRLDGGTQPREAMDWSTVEEYADEMKSGATFPPVVVYHDGIEHWLADGFHRVNAAQSAGIDEIEADVRRGGKEEAVWYSCGANQGHGLRRTNADKRRAVIAALNNSKSKKLSDRSIAEHIGVSNWLVTTTRNELLGTNSQADESRTGKDGKIRKTNSKGRSEAAKKRNTVEVTAEQAEAIAEMVAPPPPTPALCRAMALAESELEDTEYDRVAELALRLCDLANELTIAQRQSILRIVNSRIIAEAA